MTESEQADRCFYCTQPARWRCAVQEGDQRRTRLLCNMHKTMCEAHILSAYSWPEEPAASLELRQPQPESLIDDYVKSEQAE